VDEKFWGKKEMRRNQTDKTNALTWTGTVRSYSGKRLASLILNGTGGGFTNKRSRIFTFKK
jgi:hypothetical protein